MRKNAAWKNFGWMAAAVLGVVVAGGWSGVKAQATCGFQPDFCPGIDWDDVKFNVNFLNAANSSPQCHFVAGITNHQPHINNVGTGFKINGIDFSNGGVTDAIQPALPEKADGGYYIYTPPVAGTYYTYWTNVAKPNCIIGTPVNLTIINTKVGIGDGSTNPAGSAAPGTTYIRSEGSTVKIIATRIGTSTVMWSPTGATGCNTVSTNGDTCTVTMDVAKTITATFNPPVTPVLANWYYWNRTAGSAVTPGTGNLNWTGTPATWSAGGTDKNTGDPLVTWTANATAGTRNVLFSGPDGGTRTIAVNGAVTVDTVRVVTNGYTIAGTDTLTLRNGQIVSEKPVTINSVLNGANGLTFAGGSTGTLTLGGNNTYTGTTTISSGTLIASHNNAFGTGTAAVTVSTGATLTLSGGITVSKPLTVNNGITVSSSGNNTWSGVISGGNASSVITKTGAGDLILTGANTYTGTTTVAAGNLQIGGTAGQVSGPITVGTGSNVIFNRSNAATHAGVISGAGGLIKQGSGVLTLTGANTYAGATTVSAGTLRYTTAAPQQNGKIIVETGAVLEFDNAAAMTYAGDIGGAANTGRINKIGEGALTLSGANRAKIVNIEAGTLNMYGELNADTVTVAGGGTLSTGGDISGGRVVLFQGSSGGTIVLGGGNISSLDMAPNSVMKYENGVGAPIDVAGTLNLNGTLDVTVDLSFPFTSYLIASYAAIGTGRFQTVRVNGDTVARYNNGILVLGSQKEIDGNYFEVEAAGGEVNLVVSKIDLSGIDNYLSVINARFISSTQVELVVRGMSNASAYSASSETKPYIDSVGIWYRPNGPVAAIGQTGTTAGAALLSKINFGSLLNDSLDVP
ncbi:MAG: autotransporter-associated beta strand repeat-containing protein, partial [Chitinispirillales bacterium]|nr:autotransporter-associated beta strand repeat-containing protein [Chitinispirillales bacterium]